MSVQQIIPPQSEAPDLKVNSTESHEQLSSGQPLEDYLRLLAAAESKNDSIIQEINGELVRVGDDRLPNVYDDYALALEQLKEQEVKCTPLSRPVLSKR